MKTKCYVISIFLFSLVFFIFVSCEKEESRWKGTIEEVNGVTIVKNPKEPMYDEDVLSLEEELSIGKSESGEEPMFSQIRGIAVDEQEKIYILDIKEGHIKVFDSLGNYLITIGKKGQGPGEMQYPAFISITPQNEIIRKLFKMKKIGIEIPKNFLSLWKDANPGIAEIEDVRERLVGLKR